MNSVQKVKTSFQALRKVAIKSKPKKSVLESVDNVSSSVVLLNSSSPSSLTFDKLASVLRAPFVPLYSMYTEAALNVASAILEVVLNKVLHFISKEENCNTELQAGWERVAHSALSGVIDHLESNESVKTKSAIAKAFYSIICDFFFKAASDNLASIGVTLRCTAFMVLSDTATLHHENQSKLREDKVLGANALGKAVSMTRDFAALEALLNLFAVLLPSSSVPQKRRSYIRDVFSRHGGEIVTFLDTLSTKEWDEAAAKVVDILAASDISFPQPFDVDEVNVCHNKYPQPEASDRFYVDRTCFFVNVRQEDELYEDLQIKFNIVTSVKISSAGERTTPVLVTLDCIPKMSGQEVSVKNGPPVLRVDILNCDIPRLRDALWHRNLKGITGSNKRPRISVSATLDLDEYRLQGGKTSPGPVLSQKIQNVDTFYSLHSDQSEAARAGENENGSRAIDSGAGGTAEIRPEPKSKEANPKDIQEVPHKINPSIFGATDEELSDINKAPTAHANAQREKPSVTKATKPPAVAIALSSHKSETPVKSTLRTKKCTRKRLQKRSDSDVDNAKGTQTSKNGRAPNDDTLINAVSTSDGKSVAAEETAPPVRPRRTAAAAASAKLVKAFAGGSEDTAKEVPQKKLATALPLDEIRDSGESSSEIGAPSVNQEAKGPKVAKASSSGARILEPVDLCSSSPTSKISRMKAKAATTGTQTTCSKAQKRTIDKTSGVYEEASTRKKQRSTQPTDERKNGRQDTVEEGGTKANNNGLRDAGWQESVNWDAVPSRAKQQETLLVTPVKGKVSGKPASKKENAIRSVKLSKKSETKQRSHNRVPLQAISVSENEAAKANESDAPLEVTPTKSTVSNKSASHLSTEGAKSMMSAVLPSLEEVLVQGATVENVEVPKKVMEVIEIADDGYEGPPNLETGVEDLPAVIDLDDEPDVHEVAKEKSDAEMVLLEEPRTPTPSKAIGSTPVRKVQEERQLKKALDLDPDIFDLTNEDVRKVLQTLRERKAKRECNLGTTSRQSEGFKMKILEADGRDSSNDENDKSVLPLKSLRPKVTFDAKPRYKSVSLESKPDEDVAEPCVPGHISRKHRLRDIKLMPIESTTRKRQDQPKDPSMQDIINVLDAIQNVIVSNIANKSRAVRSDVRAARDRLIREAADDLCEMREESVGHYNKLLFLENEYANVNRKLSEGMENTATVNADLCKFVRQTIGTHDRGTVSKKLPQTLLASGLPASFQKFV